MPGSNVDLSTGANAGVTTPTPSGTTTPTPSGTSGIPLYAYLGAGLGLLQAFGTYQQNSQIHDTEGYEELYKNFGNQTYTGDFNSLIQQRKNSYLDNAPSWRDIRIMDGSAKTGSAISSGFSGAMAGAGFGHWGLGIGALVGLGASLLGSSRGDSKAKQKEAELKLLREEALEDNHRNFLMGMQNAEMQTDFQALSNLAAFGGPLQSYGGDWSNGLISIDNGGSHEGNPYEGVPMGTDQNGTPNLVEEGETVFMDYVFSKRLSVPKAIREKYKLRGAKALSFAEASKKLAKESEERPNDPISQRGLEAAMADLAMEQEKLRSRKSQQQVNKFDTGGPFNSYGYVSNYNGGWYGADGNYTQEYLDRLNALTAEQLQAQFDDQYSFYSDDANKGSDRWKAIDAFYKANPQYKESGYKVTADDVARAKRLGQDNKPGYMHYLVNNATAPPPKPTAALNRYYLRTPKEGGGYELTEMEAPYSGVNAETGMTWAEANPNLVAAYNGAGTVRDAVDVDGVSTTYTDYYFDTKPAEAPAEKVDLTPAEYKHRWEGLRYAPAVGLGLATLTDAFGLTNKPDYSNADAVIKAGRSVTPQQVEWNPIGNYLTYTPFDTLFYSNQLAAQANATRRAIRNNSNGNRMTAIAGLLGADYNAQQQLGNLFRQAEEYNLAQKHQVETFNRGTNQANSEGFLKAAMANQDADMKARGLGLEAQMKGYQMREAARLASDEAKAANLSGFIESLGAIGMDNAALNARDFALATGTFGPVNPGYEYILTGRKPRKRGCGGKLNKGRKGLTY